MPVTPQPSVGTGPRQGKDHKDISISISVSNSQITENVVSVYPIQHISCVMLQLHKHS
ncbi:unnamed protein product [Oncorhynchus mykiss]|uniref:Uncharacterized protein n=1 Tax=Oncorhynchus mykiss TaxID=8022 RepID=A0A060WNB4_ONCMY|nr:unnamed protein product [Oncorhynchus mykiss]